MRGIIGVFASMTFGIFCVLVAGTTMAASPSSTPDQSRLYLPLLDVASLAIDTPTATVAPTAAATSTSTATSSPTPSPTSQTHRYSLMLSRNPQSSTGQVRQDPQPGLDGRYAAGTLVTISALPDDQPTCGPVTSYWTFSYWQLPDALTSTSSQIVVVMDMDKSITASFVELQLSPCTPTPTLTSTSTPTYTPSATATATPTATQTATASATTTATSTQTPYWTATATETSTITPTPWKPKVVITRVMTGTIYDQYVDIQNQDTVDVPMLDWKIQSQSGAQYTFANAGACALVLKPTARLRLWSTSGVDSCYDPGLGLNWFNLYWLRVTRVWSNTHDKATLISDAGVQISVYQY